MSEVQKQQALAETQLQVEQGKSQFAIQKLQQEAEIKKQLMELEFQYNMQLTKAQGQAKRGEETFKEDRKDERTKIQASQQSELIDQRKNDLLPKSFESTGNDVLGGFGLDEFEPQ
jgi:transposase